MNGGTRTRLEPAGDGSLPREILGNQQADRTGLLCSLLVSVGDFHSIGNPICSSVFLYDAIASLSSLSTTFDVKFAQCV